MSGLRFCMVTTFYPPYNYGGDGIGIQRFSQALIRRGHQVTVVQDIDAFFGEIKPREFALDEAKDGVDLIHLRSRSGRLSPFLTHQTGRPVVQGRKIRRILENGRFDVINFHNVSLVGGPGLLSAGRNSLKLYMAHEHWLVCPSHVLWRHNREPCTSRECLRCVLRYRRPPQLWRYTGYLQRQVAHVDTFIAMSEFSRDKHREFGFPRSMEVVNYFLPDQTQRDRAPVAPAPHSRPYFLFVGRLEKIKGLDDVIPVFRHYPNADLLIAGEGRHASILRGIAEGIPNVKFLGGLSSDALDRYYRHALALIVPSVGFETFGIILIEAFRQSTPVIARRIGPFPEIVNRSGGGVLFGDSQELIPVMRQFQTEDGFRQRLGCAGYQAFVKYWSEAAVMPRYLDVVRRTALAKGRKDVVKKLEAEAIP
jgi:glycosyltransferase involved in cell wall biosynthesis